MLSILCCTHAWSKYYILFDANLVHCLCQGVLQRQSYLIEKTRSKSTEILAKNSAAQLRSSSLERKRPVNTAGRMIPV